MRVVSTLAKGFGFLTGTKAFTKQSLAPNWRRGSDDHFNHYEYRKLRYAIFMAAWGNTLYDGGTYDPTSNIRIAGLHPWAMKLKADFGLYKHTRGVFNVAYRLGELHATSLISGRLGKVSDGKCEPTCLPIADIKEPAARTIAAVWQASNFDDRKTRWLRFGPVLGDAILKVIDDAEARTVYLEPVPPHTLREKEEDKYGHIKSYLIEEERLNPKPMPAGWEGPDPRPTVVYRESAERIQQNGRGYVLYRTSLDGEPHDWTGNGAEWIVPYDFVPMVCVKHIDIGEPWGLPEYLPGLVKGMEADDAGSKINDGLRKLIDPNWWVFGARDELSAARSNVNQGSSTPTQGNPTPDRQTIPLRIVQNAQGKLQAQVADFHIDHMSAHVARLLEQNIEDYPELRYDQLQTKADSSGEAIREARKSAERKMADRQGPYLAALKRALQIAASIGGIQGYPGFEGIDENSYARKELDFTLLPPPIFPVDRRERLAEQEAEGKVIAYFSKAGIPLKWTLHRLGWQPDEIEQIVKDAEAEAARKAAEALALTQAKKPEAGGAPAKGDDPPAPKGPET